MNVTRLLGSLACCSAALLAPARGARKPRRAGTFLGVVNAYPLVADVRRSGRIDKMDTGEMRWRALPPTP